MTKSKLQSGPCAIELIRRRAGTGGISKIEADSELRAFVLAHIYTLTYKQIVDKIITEFPPDRRQIAERRFPRSQDGGRRDFCKNASNRQKTPKTPH